MTALAPDRELLRAVSDALARDFDQMVQLIVAHLIEYGHDLSPDDAADRLHDEINAEDQIANSLGASFVAATPFSSGSTLAIRFEVRVSASRFESTVLENEPEPERPFGIPNWCHFSRTAFESCPFSELAPKFQRAIRSEMVAMLWNRLHDISRSMDMPGDPFCARGFFDDNCYLLNFLAFRRRSSWGIFFDAFVREYLRPVIGPPSSW